MKRLIGVLLVLMLLPLCAFAQDTSWKYVDLGDLAFPTANIDNLFIPIANPSLLATGHASGLGWANMYDEKDFRKHYWLFANMEGLSYIYEYSKNPADKSLTYHTIATGSELMPANILPNLYVGANYRWLNNHIGKGQFRTALTYRPTDATSLALQWDNPYKGSPEYHAGLAIRPLAFIPSIKDYRLELSADMDYRKDVTGDYAFQKPVLGVNTQILDGVSIGATYDLDNETAMLNFSLSSGSTELGTIARISENDNFAIPYIHLTEDVFHPFLGITGRNWYNMKLNGSLVSYKSAKYTLGPVRIFDSGTKSIDKVIKELKTAKEDPSIQGIVLKNPSFSASLALAQEMMTAVKDFKSAGKKVTCYFDNISNGGYIFASSVADDIYLNPMGSVDLRGLSITSPYFKELLDTLGVDVLNFRSHKYKSAGNQFSETEMTAAEREVYESLLQSFYNQIVTSIADGRGEKLTAPIAELIDKGPYMIAQDAMDAGLVDALIYEDEVNDLLKKDYGFSKSKSDLPDYRDYDWAKQKESLVAVIYAQGNIVMGKGTSGQKIACQTTVDLIRAARKNSDYKGIILRVDSGGGSAQASDIILRELELAQTENKKPVVVSMGGVAGSGGYYIACKADRIIADPATITGSIGVIGLTFNLPRLFDKVKVNWSTVKKGANADYGTMYRSWSEAEKDRMTASIETIYEDFVSKVDAGRKNLSSEDVHRLAQGRVWTGEQAMENGLIDDLGGMDKAIEHMRELTGIKGKMTLIDATTSSDDGFSFEMDSDPLGSLPQMQMLNSLTGDYKELYELWRDFQNDSVLMLSPVDAESLSF